ncbi:STAS domain-containing protein [Cellulomonas sp. Y8]|uniref:STAS domain-containing protein n=1 Tax=Cellulomonas sp. Y8 TaxID=2591145 RepID=UPI003D72C5ED
MVIDTADEAALEPGGRIWTDPTAPAVLRVAGEADVAMIDRFREVVGVESMDLGRTLVAAGVREVDLSGATFIDSSVVGMVPALRPERLRVRGASGSPLTVLTLTGMDSVLHLC